MGSSAAGIIGAMVNPFATAQAIGVKKAAEAAFPIPKLPEIPAAPKVGDKAVQEAAAEAARARRRARGFRSTILSREFLEPGAPALKSTLGS